jgi:putative mRNA 3-end processing factor
MKLIFHGGAKEVGRSCIQLITEHGDEYLFDAGIKFKHHGYEYPKILDKLDSLDGLFLSHAHLDHSGALPMFYHKKLLPTIFTTSQTASIIKILLKDSYKIARIKHLNPAYERKDIKNSINKAKIVNFDKEYDFRKIKFKFLNAGHIPGSSSILIESDGKKILYSGDINSRQTNLMIPLDHSELANKIDVLIIESTYGYRQLPVAKGLGLEIIEEIKKVIKRGGSVIIPTFALGRSQELLINLGKLFEDPEFKKVPLYFDGMSTKITNLLLKSTPKYVKNIKELSRMFFKKAKIVKSQKQRNEVASNNMPKIILTTSGMVQGGPVLHYIKHMWHNPKNAIFLVGYQCKHTNGRMLLEEKSVYIKGWKTKVKCDVKKFSFSGHISRDEIFAYLTQMKPKTLIVQHGDPESVDAVCEWAKKNLPDTKVYGPKIGDEIEV